MKKLPENSGRSGIDDRQPQAPASKPHAFNRRDLLIAGGVTAVGVLGYSLYQEKKEPQGVQINLGPCGLTIEKK